MGITPDFFWIVSYHSQENHSRLSMRCRQTPGQPAVFMPYLLWPGPATVMRQPDLLPVCRWWRHLQLCSLAFCRKAFPLCALFGITGSANAGVQMLRSPVVSSILAAVGHKPARLWGARVCSLCISMCAGTQPLEQALSSSMGKQKIGSTKNIAQWCVIFLEQREKQGSKAVSRSFLPGKHRRFGILTPLKCSRERLVRAEGGRICKPLSMIKWPGTPVSPLMAADELPERERYPHPRSAGSTAGNRSSSRCSIPLICYALERAWLPEEGPHSYTMPDLRIVEKRARRILPRETRGFDRLLLVCSKRAGAVQRPCTPGVAGCPSRLCGATSAGSQRCQRVRSTSLFSEPVGCSALADSILLLAGPGS
jgi:hypothetical protein